MIDILQIYRHKSVHLLHTLVAPQGIPQPQLMSTCGLIARDCRIHKCIMVRVYCFSLALLLQIAVGALVDGLTISIPAGNPSDLQDYLCNGSLPSNTTLSLQLQQGVHVISREGFCTVDMGLMNVRLIGAGLRETTIKCTRKWGFGFSSAQNVVVEGLTFDSCGAAVDLYNNTAAVLYTNSSQFVSVSNVSFFNIYGFGVSGKTVAYVNISDVFFGKCAAGTICVGASFTSDSYATSITINRCSFVGLGQVDRGSYRYLYDGAAGLQLQGHVVADIRDCSFVGNRGSGLFAIESNISIYNCTFSGNVAQQGAALNASSVRFLSVTRSRFYYNRAYTGAAIRIREQLGSSTSPVIVVNDCYFNGNHADIGGGIFMFDLLSAVVLSSLRFTKNIACIGAAIYAGDQHNVYGDRSYSVRLIDVEVIENAWNPCTNGAMGAVVYYNEIDYLNISGSSSTGSQFVGNHPGGTIQGIGGNLHLSGRVSFRNNSGENGATIYLTNDAHLYFHENCTVSFSDNLATGLGGAIYIEGDESITTSILTDCAMHFIGGASYSINFQGNHASVAGNSIYATPIYDCYLDSINPFYPAKQSDYYTFFTMDSSNSNQILSFPVNLRVCGCRYGNSWVAGTNISTIPTYPGAILQCNATLKDIAGNLSPNVVFANVVTGGNSVLPGIRLAPQQEVQWIGSECTALEYEIYGPQNTSVILLLSTKPGRNLHPIVMTLQWCEAGFALQKDPIGLLQCECSNFLSSFGVTCDINQGTVSRSGLQWIGLYTDGNEAIASTCPLRYCSANIEHMRLGRPSDICAGGRVGVLCGQCPDGLSVVFGSAECQKCSDMWLLTILLYAIMGALLVAALFLLNITVTSGSLYGLIFYANILVVNGTIFFSQSYLMPLEIIVSLINLDLGFPLCFYNGMDDLSKTGLQFVFPAYLLLISFTIVVASKYCLNWSSTGSYSFVHRIRQSIGKRAVNVLATLIYLSYSKVLRTVIDIFTYADVYIHNNITAVKVWFYDGTVIYLSGKHIVLFSFAILASVFLFLFTLALTTIPIIVVRSENNVICKWLNKNVISLPVNDAYYSPYKGRWRIWLGARLWLVVILYSLGPFLGPQNPTLLLLIHAVLVIIFTFIQILIMPFGEAVFGTCGKYKGCSMYMLNMLDLFYLLNYSLLALIVSYLLTKDADIVPIKVVVGVFVGLSIAAFFCIVIFHAIVAIHRTWSRCNATPLNRSETLHPKDEEQPESIALAHRVEFSYDVLREPLLEDSSKYILNK